MVGRKFRSWDLLDTLCICCSMLVIFMIVFSLLLFTQNAYAGITTDNPSVLVSPGGATLTGAPEIKVAVNYTGDDVSSNNSITIEWGLDGVDFSLGTQVSGVHPASPYNYTITPLDNSKTYQIRVTITDPDNLPTNNVRVYTGRKAYNPLLHNAVSTGSGSDKWGTGWGIAEGQYGEFSCGTCHVRKSGNIKRIRKDWSDATLPAVPAKTNAQTVVFDSTLDGSAQFALDDSTNHASSNRICEACHTKTAHHRNDVSSLGATDHQSSNDCVSCHKHQNAFAPSGGCSSCHGGSQTGAAESNFWPDSTVETSDASGSANDAGEHVKHMSVLAGKVLGLTLAGLLDDADSANKQLQLCNYCHALPGSDADHMSGDDADVTRFLRIGDGAIDSATAGTFDYDYTVTATATCSSVDCHNNKTTPASFAWYQGATSSCVMCHSEDGSNGEALIDPSSGLHYHATPGSVELHDGSFAAGGGNCLSCHQGSPSVGHFNSVADAASVTTYNFQTTAIDVKLNDLADTTDDTCAASCHSDNKNWYRFWSADAFDATPFDTSTGAAVTATIAADLPPSCNVCHGEFVNGWAEGSAHWNMDVDNLSSGSSHNSQNPNFNPGAACVDCHLYPDHMTPGQGLARHENGKITLTDDQTVPDEYTPYDDQTGTRTGVYCADCHEATVSPRDGNDANTFEYSLAFPGWANVEVVATDRNPIYTCFSGANGCHGDTTNNWWPNVDSSDPQFYPNREGAHYEHGTTIGELLAEQMNQAFPGSRIDADGNGRVDAIQEDRNKTCNFCHPMAWNSYKEVWESLYHRTNTPETGTVVTDVFGGYIFNGADNKGVYVSGNPSNYPAEWTDIDTDPTTGFAYQLEPDPLNPGQDPRFPLDHDGEYYQYIDAYKADSSVRNGVCSNASCHSNAPFTPQWYGDEQAPGQVTDLAAYVHMQDPDNLAVSSGLTNDTTIHNTYEYDAPGSVNLYWTAPGDNGDFDGLAYEYEVYYSTTGVITDGNLASATRAGGAASVLRKGEQQIMVVDGLTPGTPYWFAVVTKDQPVFHDDDKDGIYDVFVRDGLRSVVGATASSVPAHADDRPPVFWGLTTAESHDTGGKINLTWDAARDHSLPITYLVFWTDYSLKTHLANGGTLPSFAKDGTVYSQGYTVGSPPVAGGTDYYIYGSTTGGMSYQVAGLGEGVLYNLLVRSEDGFGNIDDNTVVLMAMANTMSQEAESTLMAVMSGTNTLIQTDPHNPSWGATGQAVLSNGQSVTFTDTADLDGAVSRDLWVLGISVDMTVTNGDNKLPQEFQVELGYDSGSFVAMGSPVVVGVGRRSSRVIKIGLSSVEGLFPADANLALRITSTVPASGSTADLTFDWGNATLKGQLMVKAQPINHEPTAPSFGGLSRRVGGYVDITWTAASDSDGGSQTLHYDLFGSADNGVTYPYVVGTGLTEADRLAGVTWDTVGDGLDLFNAGSYTCKLKLEVSDGYLYETTPGSGTWFSHRTVESGSIAVDNSQDDEAPAAVTISHVEPRPKQGAAYLHWIAVGNDGYNHGTRAAYYDIRYLKSSDGPLDAAKFASTATQVEGEPVPGFAGTAEAFEVLNMAPDTSYDIAIVTCDEGEDTTPDPNHAGGGDDNCSGLSNVYTITSGQYYCGVCHSTPPDEPDTKGLHREHGYTLEDCAMCHGDGTSPDGNNVNTYDGRHYDGVINIGWSKDGSGNHLTLVEIAPTQTSGVSVDQGAGVIYSDPDGSGGFNSNGAYSATVNTDSGRCMNFIGANASGCHGPFSPQWAPDTVEPNPVAPACADCHGDSSVARDLDPYGRVWDCNDAGAPSELVKASPPQANHGGTTTDDRYVGAHEVHLNSSFRFAKGDSCRLCHKNTFDLGLHADGNVDLLFEGTADQDEANPATLDYTNADALGVSCSSLNNMYCHDTAADWAVPGAQCSGCHGMSGKSYTVGAATSEIGHVMGQAGVVEACTYCHVAGHPQSPNGINSGDSDALLINNNAAIGISYRSGGIHLKRTYPWGTYSTLAEICWGCHDQNNDGDLNDPGDISEWGTNTSVASGSSNYNFGTLNQKEWVNSAGTAAIWNSGYGQTSADPFWYKRGPIQSTHSTDPTGTSRVTWNSTYGRYEETADSIDKIRCSNCHDVHDSNLAPGDTMTGRPYLRGSWKANPYEEDGAPWAAKTYTQPASGTTLGAVPRGGVDYDELGGFYIDQNNVVPGTGNTTQTAAHYPTSGWTVEDSAGLCVHCHGDNVDAMDQRNDVLDGNVLWLGTNGHSNSALGGDFSNGANIFDYSHGRPAPRVELWGGKGRPNSTAAYTTQVADMVYLTQGDLASAGGGYRGSDSNAGGYLPLVTNATPYGFNWYDWGASVDAGTTDNMYHQFSCSKCHSPHASRLPKLMITNCLDIRHNTWDDSKSTLQNTFTHADLSAVDRNQRAAYYASAQNCHRFDPARSGIARGGWNKVTPWTHSTVDNLEHKGASDTAYGDTSPTYHKFPSEPVGW